MQIHNAQLLSFDEESGCGVLITILFRLQRNQIQASCRASKCDNDNHDMRRKDCDKAHDRQRH